MAQLIIKDWTKWWMIKSIQEDMEESKDLQDSQPMEERVKVDYVLVKWKETVWFPMVLHDLPKGECMMLQIHFRLMCVKNVE